jgi:hypothetical protein
MEKRRDIFRLTGAVKNDRTVDAWLRSRRNELRPLAQKWFFLMRQCGDDVLELMHDGCPVACVADAPFGYVNVFRDHVNVGFFHGAMLNDPAELLEGTGKCMRHVKLKPGFPIDDDALGALIYDAYLDIKARLIE